MVDGAGGRSQLAHAHDRGDRARRPAVPHHAAAVHAERRAGVGGVPHRRRARRHRRACAGILRVRHDEFVVAALTAAVVVVVVGVEQAHRARDRRLDDRPPAPQLPPARLRARAATPAAHSRRAPVAPGAQTDARARGLPVRGRASTTPTRTGSTRRSWSSSATAARRRAARARRRRRSSTSTTAAARPSSRCSTSSTTEASDSSWLTWQIPSGYPQFDRLGITEVDRGGRLLRDGWRGGRNARGGATPGRGRPRTPPRPRLTPG